eukprot:470116-Pyramimonas_sp.AAC.1
MGCRSVTDSSPSPDEGGYAVSTMGRQRVQGGRGAPIWPWSRESAAGPQRHEAGRWRRSCRSRQKSKRGGGGESERRRAALGRRKAARDRAAATG